MWGDWLEKGKELASKAQAIALDVDKQLNESVGLEKPASTAPLPPPIDNDLEDAWDADEADFDGLDEKPSPMESISEDVRAAQSISEFDTKDENDNKNVVNEAFGQDDSTAEAQVRYEAEASAPPNEEATEVEVKPNDDTMGPPTDDIPTGDPQLAVNGEPTSDQVEAINQDHDGCSNHEEGEIDELQEVKASDQAIIDESVKDPQLESFQSEAPHPDSEGDVQDSIKPEGESTAAQPQAVPLSDIDQTNDPDIDTDAVVVEDFEMKTRDAPRDSIEPSSASQESGPVVEPAILSPSIISSFTPSKHAVNTPYFDSRMTDSMMTPDASALDSNKSQNIDVSAIVTNYEKQVLELQSQLKQREEQLFSKTEQLTAMQSMHDSEKEELAQKVQATKEEAKRRIQKAKERVDAAEARSQALAQSSSSSSEDAMKQQEIIVALREEGQKLAMKQADMEKAVRTAKGESRELRDSLEEETKAKDRALQKIESLQSDLAKHKEDLQSARRGESQAGKLEAELLRVKEDSESKGTKILALEHQLKERKGQLSEIQNELQDARQGAVLETEKQQRKLSKEHGDALSELQAKMAKIEKDSSSREDELRREVDDYRKRWQDAVRRADELSTMDNTAPLLRELESARKQQRTRASAWKELETTLRTELEDSVVENEKLSRERGEWKTKCTRAERVLKDVEKELATAKISLEDKINLCEHLEQERDELKSTNAKLQQQYSEVQQLANEGVSRVRSEMSQTVVEMEERHTSQLDSVKEDLRHQKDKCMQLENQLEKLVENEALLIPAEMQPATLSNANPKKLVQSENQVDILNGALGGLDSDGEEDEGAQMDSSNNAGSFAALSEYASRIKSINAELTTLRQRLSDSEKVRAELVEELGETRVAKEKLPLFETKVVELTEENRRLNLEVQALEEDMNEIRTSYQTQINTLMAVQDAATASAKEATPEASESKTEILEE